MNNPVGKQETSNPKPPKTEAVLTKRKIEIPHETFELAQKEVLESGLNNINLADKECCLGQEILQEEEKVFPNTKFCLHDRS